MWLHTSQPLAQTETHGALDGASNERCIDRPPVLSAKEKTHYYPMAMATHNIFPPPQTVGGAFGEERRVQYTRCRLIQYPPWGRVFACLCQQRRHYGELRLVEPQHVEMSVEAAR